MSRIGTLRAEWSDRGLRRLEFLGEFAGEQDEEGGEASPLHRAIRGWIDGEPGLPGIELDPCGTPFQLRVWERLARIPRGATTTYGALARSLGLGDGTARAVGAACAANPIALLVPCHRVVPAGGGLGGYRWGLDRKRWLLDRERDSLRFT
jgi:O-6-methylguanine DNA methyltransferase